MSKLQDIELQSSGQTGSMGPPRREVRPVLPGDSPFDRYCCACCQTPLCKEIRTSVIAVTLLGLLSLLLILAGVIILVGVDGAAFAGGVVLAAGLLFALACSYPLFSIYRKWKNAQTFEVLGDEGGEEPEYDQEQAHHQHDEEEEQHY